MAEVDLFNTAFDYVVPIYTILAIVIVILYNKRKIPENSNPERLYKFAKKGKNDGPQTWQQQMSGTWDKIERKNFYEVNVFLCCWNIVLTHFSS